MTTVEQLIGDLLLRHNCVIIPSFGGFVAKPVSAQVDYRKGTMLPPGKSLLFNRQLISNDGLLINELAVANALEFDAAADQVKQKIDHWNSQLKSGGRIEIDKVGHLFFDEEQNICFEQDRFFNLLLESFGLGTVHFLSDEDVQIVEQKIEIQTAVAEEELKAPVDVQTNILVEAPIISIPMARGSQKGEEETKTVVEHPATRKRRPMRYIAAACMLPLAFYSIWIPMKTDVLESGMISINDFNPFHKTSEGVYVKEEFTKDLTFEGNLEKTLETEVEELLDENEVYSYKFDDDYYMSVRIPGTETEPMVEDVTSPTVASENTPIFSADHMNYIVGCFGDKENAINLIAHLKSNGLDARIVDVNNGLHRVTAGSAISVEALQEIKNQTETLGLTGWILK